MDKIKRFITNNPPLTNEELAKPAMIATVSVLLLVVLARLYFSS